MRKFRFLHAADLHLDSPFRGMSNIPAVILKQIRESTFQALNQLVHVAIQEEVDFVLLSGDIYDASDRSLRAQLRFQQAMEQLANNGIQVFLVHGNHDPEDGFQAKLDWPDLVHVFDTDRVGMRIAYNRDGDAVANVYGISYATSAVTENLALRFPTADKLTGTDRLFQIGLLHTNVDGDPKHDNYAPCTRRQLAQTGIDYWALGHIHVRQVLQEEPYIVYPGNIQGRNVKEAGAKGCYVVDVDEVGRVHMTFHATDAIRWRIAEVSFDGVEYEQQLKERIDQCISELRRSGEGRPVIARLVFQGQTSLHRKLAHGNGALLEELIEEIRLAEVVQTEEVGYAEGPNGHMPFVWVHSFVLQTNAEQDLERIAVEDSFMGELVRLTEELIQDEAQLVEFSQQALDPLWNHAKCSKYIDPLNSNDLQAILLEARDAVIGLWAEEMLSNTRKA